MDRPAHSGVDTGRGSALRWVFAFCAATGATLVFLLIAITSEPTVTVAPSKLLELGYVVLPAPPKEAPKPVRPPEPKPAKPPESPAEPLPVPLAQAPVAPPEPSAAPADIASAPARTEQPPPSVSRVVAVETAAQLDNTEFSPIVNIKPLYPAIALKAAIEGYVDVDLVIDEKGRVESFSLARVSGHPSFGNETAKVIPRWRFPPPRIRGERVRIKYLYRVNFTLD